MLNVHSFSGGYVYILVFVYTPQPPHPHDPAQSCSLYLMGGKVHGGFRTFQCPPQRRSTGRHRVAEERGRRKTEGMRGVEGRGCLAHQKPGMNLAKSTRGLILLTGHTILEK